MDKNFLKKREGGGGGECFMEAILRLIVQNTSFFACPNPNRYTGGRDLMQMEKKKKKKAIHCWPLLKITKAFIINVLFFYNKGVKKIKTSIYISTSDTISGVDRREREIRQFQ